MNIYESIYKYCQILGKNNNDTCRALLAISQIEIKGYLYTEELRRQLGSIIPGIVNMTAQSLGYADKDFKGFYERLRNGSISWECFSVNLSRLLLGLIISDERGYQFDGWYKYKLFDTSEKDVLISGQSILTSEQKENLINTGKL